jgi:hypothetical protein
MSKGDALASGAPSAMWGPPVQYKLDRPTTDEPGAFTCKCGEPFNTAKAFVEHNHSGNCTFNAPAATAVCPACGR